MIQNSYSPLFVFPFQNALTQELEKTKKLLEEINIEKHRIQEELLRLKLELKTVKEHAANQQAAARLERRWIIWDGMGVE